MKKRQQTIFGFIRNVGKVTQPITLNPPPKNNQKENCIDYQFSVRFFDEINHFYIFEVLL